MADTKIADLTTAVIAAADSIPFVDASDTTQGANGSTRRITYANFLAGITSLGNLGTIQGFTFTLTGNFIRSGAHSMTLTTTGATNVTFPTTGTLATLAGSETLTNKTFDLTNNTLVGSVAEFNAALESADFYTTGGTDVALADGGTGASLTDPNADRIMFWDDSLGAVTWLDLGTNLSITGTTLNASGSGGARTVESIATGSTYTVVTGDANKIKLCVDASAQTIALNTTANGTSFALAWLAGAGTVTIDAGAGVNINGLGDGVNVTLSQAGGMVEVISTGTNTWYVEGAIGDLQASDITNLGTGAATLMTGTASGTGGLVGTDDATLLRPIIQIAALPASDDTYRGTVITGRNAGATIAQWDGVYLDSSGTWQLADANGTGTFPARGLAVAGYSSGNAAVVLEDGVARNDAWTWTVGGTVYLSTTAGGLTQSAPATSGDKVQIVGYALTADSIRVKLSPEYLTIT